METGVLLCSANLEWLNQQGVTTRKVAYKTATSRLIRNEFKKMYIEISTEKVAPIRLELKGITVHKNFMKEGKASIKFLEVRCTLFLSNAPPDQLFNFLRTMYVKMTGEKTVGNQNGSIRTQLLSGKPKQFEDISPLTVNELNSAHKKVSKSTDTTPSPLSRKRKASDEEKPKGPAAKKLYAASPILDEPLNIQQKEVLDACLAGHNVFFTGSAGTGKSYLLRKIIGALPPNVTMATASTGVAACHIGGITLHQFAGLGYGEATLERCYEKVTKSSAAQVWRRCKHLIIDEISMVEGEFFEKIEAVARYIRKNDKPFGGIQLILCGDFFQLPPVNKTREKNRFCFQSKVWDKCVQRTFELTQVHRQSDRTFIDILNNIRLGRVSDETVAKLTATSKQKIETNGILATRLCSHTQDANIINESKLNGLPGDVKVFEALDSDPSLTKQLDQQTNFPSRLELKVGAQVMLLKNISVSSGFVNGARGVVKSFKEGLPVVVFRNKKEYIAKPERLTIKTANGGSVTRKQVPLRLAWAFSIHKSQGLTLDCVEMSLGRVFESGQAYVALSRAQSLETLRVLDFKANQVWANPDVLSFYKKLREQMDLMDIIPLGRSSSFNNNNASNKDKKVVKSKPKLLAKKMLSAPLVSIS